MCRVAVCIVLASVAQAHAELQVTPVQNSDLDNTTLGFVMSNNRMSSFQQGPRSVFRTPQQLPMRNVPMYQQQAPLMRNTLTQAEGGGPASEWISNWKAKQAGGGGATVSAKDSPELWATNVFGKTIENCPASDGSATCTYKGDAPQICVGIGPRQREGASDPTAGADATTFLLTKPMEANMWNAGLLAQCISIWDYTSETGTDIGSWLRFGNSDVIPKCDAMPAAVLKSEYTAETYQTCEYQARDYKYVSPASSKYKADNSVVTNKDPFFVQKPSVGEAGIGKVSTRCARFRKVIDDICDICAVQAAGADKSAITTQCTALKSTVPADADARAGKWLPFKVFKRGMPWKAGEGGMFAIANAPPAVALMGLFVASALIFAKFRVRSRASTIVAQPFLG